MASSQMSASLLEQGVRHHISGQTSEAERSYRQVLQIQPGHPRASQYLGVLLFQGSQRKEGLTLLEAAARQSPTDSEAWSNLGNAYRVLSRGDEAIAALRRAIEIDPNNASAYCTLSACLRKEGTLLEAIEAARTASGLKPDLAQAHCNLGHGLLESGDSASAIGAFEQALYLAPNSLEARQSLAFALLYSDRHTRDDARAAAKALGNLFSPVPAGIPRRALTCIGFLSGDFRTHPVAYFLEPVLANIDRGRYRIVLLSNSDVEDDWTTKLRMVSDDYVNIVESTAQDLQEVCQRLSVDVLVDLAGHTASNRADAVALRLAPVQVSWLGYSGTTGLQTMDWLLTDPVLDCESDPKAFTEASLKLPHSVFCFDPSRIRNSVSQLPASDNGFVTFGSFNNLAKIGHTTLCLWCEVLKQVPGSRMVVKSLHLGERGLADRLMAQFRQRGIASDRVDIRGYILGESHFDAYSEIDICLDTFPYTGATTTIEALYMGVPVVSLRGDRYASRMSESILAAIGHRQWTASTKAAYVETATDLAGDLERLTEIRASLRAEIAASPLCDATGFANDFISVLEHAWDCRRAA